MQLQQADTTQSSNAEAEPEHAFNAEAVLMMCGVILGQLASPTRSHILTQWCTLYLEQVGGVTEQRRAILAAAFKLAKLSGRNIKAREAYVATVRDTIEAYLDHALASDDQLDVPVVAALQHAYGLAGPKGERLADACEAPLIVPDLLHMANEMFNAVEGAERDELFCRCAAAVHWNVAAEQRVIHAGRES